MGAFSAITNSLGIAALIALSACNNPDNQPEGNAPASITVFSGGTIYTGIDGQTAEAVAVANGGILAVGTKELVISSAGDAPSIVDLAGASLYPGFTDAHAHMIGIGFREMTLNLEDISSVEELVSVVATNVQEGGSGETLFGRGWIETGWPEGRMPNRDDLDPVSGDTPVILSRADGHAAVVNSAALDAAGINANTPDPDGGKIERDANGRVTGILIDNAMNLTAALISTPTAETKREAFKKASDVYVSYGWTGMHNMSVDPSNVDVMEGLSDAGEIDIRVYNSVNRSGLSALVSGGAHQSDNGQVITRAVKLYVDGALGSRGAALSEPYTDRPDTSGLMLISADDAQAFFSEAITADIQINTHAIGDRANTLLLDWYQAVFENNPDQTDTRWRIEHAQILHTEDIPRFAKMGVIASMQPSHAIGDLFFAPDRLGIDRLAGAYAWRSLIDSGAVIAGGSDAPVERGDPLIEFYAAVARRGLNGYQDENWNPDQAVSRDEALKMFTLWPAYAAFQEDALGTIEPGKRADFTVFSKDIMTIPEDEILTAKPVMTVVNGEIVFNANELTP